MEMDKKIPFYSPAATAHCGGTEKLLKIRVITRIVSISYKIIDSAMWAKANQR